MRAWLVTLGIASMLIILVIGWIRLGVPMVDAEPNNSSMRMWVTAYSSCVYDIRIIKPCDGITASGRRANWGTVACGPGYPFGTVFDVPGVGRMTCWDRGGGVGNHMIDIWFPEEAQAWKFGAKWMDVRIYTTAPSAPAPVGMAPAAAAPRPAPIHVPPDGVRYTVVAGDTLSYIAQRYDTEVRVIAEANGIQNVNLIHAGQVLIIPGRDQQAAAETPQQPAEQAATAPAPAQAEARRADIGNPQPAAPQAPPPVPTPVTLAQAPLVEEPPLTRLAAPALRGDLNGSLGQLLADSLRAEYRAAIGLAAGRDLRTDLPGGVVTAAQVRASLVADRKSLTQDLRGATLRRALEHSLSGPAGWEGTLHVAGLTIGFNPNAPVGRRISRLLLSDGRPLADNAWYRVALTEGVYFAPGFTAILEEGKGLIAYQPLGDLLVNALKQREVIQPPQEKRWSAER